MVEWMLNLWLLAASTFLVTAATKQPHIIFMLADDLGWNFVSWHNESVITPHMQELVDNGVELDQSYVQPLCTPSRSALMTGMYPYKIGRQGDTIQPSEPSGLSLEYTLLPEQLHELGYHTHIVGKWHMGFCDWAYTPLYRGFDTFYGFYNGATTYYDHMRVGGYDFRDQENIDFEANMTYSTDLFTARAVDVILSHQHLQDEPMFMYLPFQAIHSPHEVPEEYSQLYEDFATDQQTKNALGMVTAMDEGIGLIVEALKVTGMYEDTIIIFSTDNGGIWWIQETNYPLHGHKTSMWEGGTRGAAFIHSPLLENTPRIHSGLLHITDWHNTLLSAAGATQLPDNDGYDQWEVLRTGSGISPREDLIYNLHGEGENFTAAIRVGDYKYVYGVEKDGMETWLINIADDPNESTNLIDSNPDMAAELHSLLLTAAESQVPADEPPISPDADPENFDGTWSSGWCEAK